MGIERFVDHRGVAGVIWSDNCTNFIATEKDLPKNIVNWNQQTLTDSLVKKSIKWNFNPPSAPHHGFVWERLLRSFKHTFYSILDNRRLTDEIFSTIFCFVKQNFNARPLVPASVDVTELDAFTPNHLLPAGNSGLEPTFVGKLWLWPPQALYRSARLLRCHLEPMVGRIRTFLEQKKQIAFTFQSRPQNRRSCLDCGANNSERLLSSCARS